MALLRERFLGFVQTISTLDGLRERENAALHAHMHDLTKLLAAFDLCELQDPHLIAVRDRAFQRDFIPEVQLLRLCCRERRLQQDELQRALDDELAEQEVGNNHHGQSNEVAACLENNSSVSLEIEGLQQRIELLEREVVILHLRQELSEETTSRMQWPPVTVEADQDGTNDQAQVDRHVCEEHCEEAMKAIQEQQQRIVELEDALATASNKNAALQHQILRYRRVENILLEFSRCHSSAS